MEKFDPPRRTLLIFSTGVCSLTMGLLGTVRLTATNITTTTTALQAAFLKENEPSSPVLQWAGPLLPLILLLAFTFSFTLGLGPVPWVLIGEIFPARAR